MDVCVCYILLKAKPVFRYIDEKFGKKYFWYGFTIGAKIKDTF